MIERQEIDMDCMKKKILGFVIALAVLVSAAAVPAQAAPKGYIFKYISCGLKR